MNYIKSVLAVVYVLSAVTAYAQTPLEVPMKHGVWQYNSTTNVWYKAKTFPNKPSICDHGRAFDGPVSDALKRICGDDQIESPIQNNCQSGDLDQNAPKCHE